MRLRHGAANMMAKMGADDAQDDSAPDDIEYDPRQLEIDRNRNDQRLKSRFEHIFSKYEHDFEGVGDEIDISTGKIVVNNGHLQHMQHEADPGKSASSLFAQAFQDELEHEEDDEDDEDEDEDVEGGAAYGANYLDEPLHSSGIEDMPTVTTKPPNLAVNLRSGSTEKPIPRLAHLIASDSTPRRAESQVEEEPVPEAPSSAITVSGLATPLLARVPGLYQSLRDAQPGTGRRSVGPEAVKALGVSIANQLAQYMPGSGQRKKKAKDSRLSLPLGVTDPTWAYPELPASVTQKRVRPSSPIGSKVGSSPVPDTTGQESLWTAEGVVRPRKRRRTQAEIANGTPASAMPLVIRPSSSGKGRQTAELRRCWNCSLTRTPSWQQGPHGQDLCESCGRYFERYRRMKPFDSPTPEPEERVPKQVQIVESNIHHPELDVLYIDHESDRTSNELQALNLGVDTRSSPPILPSENDVRISLQAQAPDVVNATEAVATLSFDDGPGNVSATTELSESTTNASTYDKPLAYVMLPTQTAEDLQGSVISSPQQTNTGITGQGTCIEVHNHEHIDSPDGYVNGFETTPAGQLERRMNPLLHHNPASTFDQSIAGVGTTSPAADTPASEPSCPTTPSSSGHGAEEEQDDDSARSVAKTTLWKNSAWNNSQDELLLELREEQDLEWEDISGLLPGHSPEAVERRYELLIDAAAHTMRVSSQSSAAEPAPLWRSSCSEAKVTFANSSKTTLSDETRPSQKSNVSRTTPMKPATTPWHIISTDPHLSTSPTAAASAQVFSSPADDYSPLPDFRQDSEDVAGVTPHETPCADTTITFAVPGATPSTAGRKDDFALIDDVFDNAGLADPSQQLFREMGSSPSPAPAFGDSGSAGDSPPHVHEGTQELECSPEAEQIADSGTPHRPAARSPYHTRKRLSDQSARDSVVEAADLSLCSRVLESAGDDIADDGQRPRLSYAQLVEAAFIAHDRRPMRSVDVFTWVESKYSWFRKLKDSPLRACIRATLSAKPQFVRVDMPDGTKAWRFLKPLDVINAKIRSRRKSRRITIGTDFADSDPMDVSQLIEEEDELATPKTTSMRKSLLRKFVSPRMSTPVPIFVQSTKKMDKRRSSGRYFLDLETGTPMREVDPDEDELSVL